MIHNCTICYRPEEDRFLSESGSSQGFSLMTSLGVVPLAYKGSNYKSIVKCGT